MQPDMLDGLRRKRIPIQPLPVRVLLLYQRVYPPMHAFGEIFE
jgi:hypothetical protein